MDVRYTTLNRISMCLLSIVRVYTKQYEKVKDLDTIEMMIVDLAERVESLDQEELKRAAAAMA